MNPGIEPALPETTLPEPVQGVPGATDDWWSTVQEDIRQSEYHVTWQEHTYLEGLGAAYQAPNRAHNLRTTFTPRSISDASHHESRFTFHAARNTRYASS